MYCDVSVVTHHLSLKKTIHKQASVPSSHNHSDLNRYLLLLYFDWFILCVTVFAVEVDSLTACDHGNTTVVNAVSCVICSLFSNLCGVCASMTVMYEVSQH